VTAANDPAAFSPILKHIGYGLSLKEACVMVWGGLRGAVSLSLALLVDGNHLIGERARELIFLQTVGIVTLTLLINGTTAGWVYKRLNVYPPNPFRSALATQGLRRCGKNTAHRVDTSRTMRSLLCCGCS
jgi:NhaP-type Na+/H+ or K+/H+ antiporter